MRILVVTGAFLLSCGMTFGAGQSSNSGNQDTSDAGKTVAQSSGNSTETAADKTKPKKVWTNEEVSNVGGDGAISVVGKPGGGDSNRSPNNSQKNAAILSAKYKQAAPYRDRLRKLNNQLEATDKKISELRNFNGDNGSPSGGINMHQRYDRTPIDEQIKELEEKKKEIKAQIEAVEDQARKNGFEAGQLR
jgi:hypothetical protein